MSAPSPAIPAPGSGRSAPWMTSPVPASRRGRRMSASSRIQAESWGKPSKKRPSKCGGRRTWGMKSDHRPQLDAVDAPVLGQDVGGEDELVTRLHVPEPAEHADRVLDRDVGLGGERKEVGFDRAEEPELPEKRGRGREGEDRRVHRPEGREPVR